MSILQNEWTMKASFGLRRHLPGVGVFNGQIFVIGGADDNWQATSAVEAYDPLENGWFRMPDLNVPRAHPAVVTAGGELYVLGGRNSKKVELKSVERFDVGNNAWIILDNGLKHKRWSSAAVPYKDDCIIVVGGRGKWVGNSVEVYSPKLQKFSLALNGPSLGDRAYTATNVTAGMAIRRKILSNLPKK